MDGLTPLEAIAGRGYDGIERLLNQAAQARANSNRR